MCSSIISSRWITRMYSESFCTDEMIYWSFEQEQSWDVASQSLTISTNTPHPVEEVIRIHWHTWSMTNHADCKSFTLSCFSLFWLLRVVFVFVLWWFFFLCCLQLLQVSHICLTFFCLVDVSVWQMLDINSDLWYLGQGGNIFTKSCR